MTQTLACREMQIPSLADLLGIAAPMALQTQEAYNESWRRKSLLELATTLEEIIVI